MASRRHPRSLTSNESEAKVIADAPGEESPLQALCLYEVCGETAKGLFLQESWGLPEWYEEVALFV